jgi:hypothetical protein
LCLEEVDISEPCLEQVNGGSNLQILGTARPQTFDAEGNLAAMKSETSSLKSGISSHG